MVQNTSSPKPRPDPRPRGRPRKYDPDAALDAARDVFALNGYAAASLDDLAAAMGMNRPSLYAAFGDKEQLYLACLNRMGDFLTGSIATLVNAGLTPTNFLKTFFSAAIDIYLRGEPNARGCFITGTALTEAVVSEKVQTTIRETFAEVERLLETRLAAYRKAGDIPKDADPRAIALLMTSTMHELSILARTGAGRKRMEERARLAIKLMRI